MELRTAGDAARADLGVASTAATLTDIANAIAHRSDDTTRLRLFFEFTRGADEAGLAALPSAATEPPSTGLLRYDALLAAAAEHLTNRFGLPAPLWTAVGDRFLSRAWWISPLPSARTHALVWTPAAFRRRGIYLDRHDLTHDGVIPIPEPLFDKTELHNAFTALAEKLQRRGVVGHVHVFGGAAMILAYNPQRIVTRDIDELFTPDGPVVAAIREVAIENGWPTTWLNSQASSYASRTPGEGARVFDHPYLQVAATPPDHLLAMKVLAARAVRDADDLRFLIDHLSISKPEQVWAVVERFFPGIELSPRSRALVEDILAG